MQLETFSTVARATRSAYQLEEECRLVRLQSGLLVCRADILEEAVLGMEFRSGGKLLDELWYR